MYASMPDVVDHPVARYDVAKFVLSDRIGRARHASFRYLGSVEDEHEVRRPGSGGPHDGLLVPVAQLDRLGVNSVLSTIVPNLPS